MVSNTGGFFTTVFVPPLTFRARYTRFDAYHHLKMSGNFLFRDLLKKVKSSDFLKVLISGIKFISGFVSRMVATPQRNCSSSELEYSLLHNCIHVPNVSDLRFAITFYQNTRKFHFIKS